LHTAEYAASNPAAVGPLPMAATLVAHACDGIPATAEHEATVIICVFAVPLARAAAEKPAAIKSQVHVKRSVVTEPEFVKKARQEASLHTAEYAASYPAAVGLPRAATLVPHVGLGTVCAAA